MPQVDIVQIIQTRNWLLLAPLIITIAVQVFRRAPWTRDAVWQRIPDGWRWLVPIVAGAATAFVDSLQSGATLSGSLNAALGGAFGLGVPAMGLAALLRESPLPWDGGAGGKSKGDTKPPTKPPAVLAGLVGVLLALVVACSAAQEPPAKPPCDSATAAAMAAECATRTELECASKGVPEEDCQVIKDCDRRADERKAQCQ